jgi:hypothetical protein
MNKYNNWFITVYKTFIYVAIILFLIYLLTSGSASIGALLTAFFLFILGLLMLLFLTINHIQTISIGHNFSWLLYQIIKQTGPILLNVGFIGYILYLIFIYKNMIESGNVSSSYNTFMNISVMLIFVQIYILMQNQTIDGHIYVSNITSGVLYLLNIILFVCVNIIHTILQYFTTDGFRGNIINNTLTHTPRTNRLNNPQKDGF